MLQTAVMPVTVLLLSSETVPQRMPSLALQVAELKRDLEARLTAVAATSKAEASKAEFQVRL